MLSIGNSGVSYSALDEIWDNYKYPPQKQFSYTGYDMFKDYEFNDNAYTTNPNISGQSVLPEKRPKAVEFMNNNNEVVEGFQSSPMDYPSTSKPELQSMYNHKPYDKDDKYMNISNDYNNNRRSCDEYIEHIERCRFCYEHLRKSLKLENDGGWNLNTKNLLDIAMIVIGGAFILFVLDVFMSVARKINSLRS